MGKPSWNKGIPCSEETKRKLSEATRGRIPWNKGITITGEYLEKIKKVNKGRVRSQEFKDKESKTRTNMFLNGYTYSKETRKKISKVNSGEKSHFWKGGLTALSSIIRESYKYRQWRSDVYTRDNFTCQECGQIGKRLNAHHIKSFSSILQFYEITTIEEALECEELWNINNGITLCKECHWKLRGDKNEFNKNPDD